MANKLTFKTDNCKGCGLCVDVCPKQVLALAEEQINKKGHHPVVAVNESGHMVAQKAQPMQASISVISAG